MFYPSTRDCHKKRNKMIKPVTPIKLNRGLYQNFEKTPKDETEKENNTINDFSTEPFKNSYAVNFTGILNKKGAARRDKMRELKFDMTSSAEELLKESTECAKKFRAPEVTEYHVLYTSLRKISDFIDGLNDGTTRYNQESTSFLHEVLEGILTFDLFKNKDLRNDIKPVIDKEADKLEAELKKQSAETKSLKKNPELSDRLLNSIYGIFASSSSDLEDDNEDKEGFLDSHILAGALYPDNNKFRQEVSIPLRNRLKEAVMIDKTPQNERSYIPFYDNKAENIWKNLAVGTNMIVLHDPDVNPEYTINSFNTIFRSSDKGFGRLNKDNTEIVEFNKYASQDLIEEKIRQAEKDKDKNYVFIFDLDKARSNTTTDCSIYGALRIELQEQLRKPPKNVSYVVISEKDNYYSKYKPDDPDNPFKNYGEISVPILNAEQTKKILKTEDTPLLKNVKKTFSGHAIDALVDATSTLPGNYPEKTVEVMEKAASYFIDKKEITASDVQEYIKEAKHVFKTAENDSAINLVFNTGKKLKDMVGSDGTKKEASSIVRGIKDKSIGTKGYIVYAQDSSQGAGRKYMAQVIAGEAKVPYVEINALDFGTEKIDLFGALFGGGNSMTPEASMKKLFELVKSQAETNNSKSAVLFIENFEYFSVGEQVSEFHQKAMSQLLREMDNAKKQGFNIVVMGSMNDPQYIGASTLKSGKFIDEIAIESPANNKEARFDILNYYIKQKKYKIEGKTPEEREAVIRKASEITEGLPYAYMLVFLDKAQNVARERGKRTIGNTEFVESLLQLDCGRASSVKMSTKSKELVTSHECGHALNLQFMYDLLKEQGDERHLPDKVSFITLDPRGNFGGAMYHGKSENDQWSFGKIFSDIICSFGGHSCEKLLYGVDGSWGISGDMEQATERAQLAVQYMGLGPHTGKIHIDNTITGSLDLSPLMREKYDMDIDCFLKNANLASDMIVDVYEPFVREFTEKYKDLVGTGECIIPSETFETELNEWTARQDEEKLSQIKELKQDILRLISDTKRGKVY